MLQTKKTKRNLKRKRLLRASILLGYFLFILSLTVFFWWSYMLGPKDLFLSPMSKAGAVNSLASTLEKNNVSYKSIERKSDYYLVKTSEGGEILISSKKNIASQVSSLQLILARLKIEGKTFKRLDFRYEKTVILF